MYLVMFVLVQPPSDYAEDDVTTVGYLSNGEQISLATQLILRKIEDSWWACNRLLRRKIDIFETPSGPLIREVTEL